MRALDRIDFEILDIMQKDARITNKELAARVNLAPSTCLERVRSLRGDGAFVGFHARVDPEALGIGLQALTQIRLKRHVREVVDRFRDHCLELDEVVAVYHVSGATDFLVHVVVRDADHLRDFLMDAFTTWPEIDHLETSVVFSQWRKTSWPRLVEPS